MKRILTFLLLLFSAQLFAQNYPITGITISLPANPDASTVKWNSSASMITITAAAKPVNGRIDGRVQESKILITIKKGGNKICGSYTSSSAPSANFNSPTKVWSGNNVVSLLGQDCTLPPGDYELCVQFFGAGPAGIVPMSEEKCKSFTIKVNEQITYQSPQLISPANGNVLKEMDLKKPMTFRWTPVIPKPRETVTYRVRVWQLMQGQNGTQAMKANQPIITKDVDNLTQITILNLESSPCKPPYLCDFIWNVQALDREGKPIGGNNGTSEAFGFTVQPVNDPPSILKLLMPRNGSIISANETLKFTWTNFLPVPDLDGDGDLDGYYKIKIVEIKGDESPESAIRGNKPHFEKDSIEALFFQYPSSAPVFKQGKKYAWHVQASKRESKSISTSDAFMFTAGSCDVNLILKLKSIECLPPTFGNNNYKICLSATYNSSVYNLTYNNTGSGFKAYNPSYSLFYGISNITPALQVQNNGSTTTVNYCFDVIVSPGQTIIKIGLQGDDKDPGPIVCQPGAELDVQLPNCKDECKCGTWSALSIQNPGTNIKYDCGSTIPWKCKQPFNFSSSYQCNPNNKDCQAKVKWTITKDGNPYSSGTGTTGAFTPTANGTYTITLEADCNGIKCPPCVYTIIVKDCIPLSCECSNDMYVIAKPGEFKIRCKETKIFDYGTTITLVPQNICNPADCLSDWTIKVYDLTTGAFITSGSGTGSASSFALTLNSLSGYKIEVTGNCNGKKCVCTFYIRTNSTAQSCGCGTWKDNIVAFTSNPSGCVISGSVKCKKSIRLLPGTPYTFTSPVYNCNLSNDTCNPVYTWSVNGIPQGTGSTLTYTFSAANNVVSINTNCGGKVCDSCVFEVTLPSGRCDSTLNQVMYDSASFISSLSSSQLINFSTNDNGTPMSNPSADFALSCYTWNGITFSDARSYWNLLIYGGVIKIAFPPGMYKKAGFEMSQFYGNNGNVTVKVYSGNCVYTYTWFANASLPNYFGINLPAAIDRIEVSHSISPIVIDNFRFGN